MLFNVIDNTGVKFVKLLKVYPDDVIKPGLIVTVSIKKVLSFKKFKKGQICKGVIVRLVSKNCRYGNSYVSYIMNSIIILKKNELIPIGSRIKGSVFFELRKYKYLRVVILSAFLI